MLPLRIHFNASRHVGCKNPTSCDQTRSTSTSTTPPTHPEVIFSGIQPTGVPHLGNYLGALKQWVDLQNSAPPSTELLYCVVDLHAITQPQDPHDLRRRRQDTMAMLLAVGLKAERCVIFEQSRVAAHSQLMSPLDPDGSSKLKLGLFSYPVLQAADILLYGTTLVPVGEDQVQHLELARSLAGKFNRTFGKILVVPKVKLAPAKRVMSLTNPTSKMSKSGTVNSQINLDHSESEIRLRIRGALTDSIPGISYDREARPGVSNLIEMMGNMMNRDDFEVIAQECEGLNMKEFKDRVADSVVEGLKGIKGEYERIKGDASYLEEVSRIGAEKANKRANETLGRVMEAMGMGVGPKPSGP
ncbi:Tryptophan--tRNA ligase, mitochondrial [Orbilia oligospora]|nr:Tryptophan--tRNA ligase, mitochondrial [Orbilia oligospora]